MIFFDIDETLFDNKSAQYFAALSLYDQYQELQIIYAKSAFLQRWNAVTEKYLQLFFANQISFQQQRRKRLREMFKKDLSNREADKISAIYLKFYKKNWGLFDDVIPCLNTLSSRKLGIISNGDKDQQRQKLRDLNILERFEVIIISDDIGISKPDPKIFWHGCKKANEKLAECYYVGDNFHTDAKAASEARLKGIWLNREPDKGKDATLIEISTLSQLPEMIQS
jgi:putative hydrolase of the HAD superfamily